LIKKLTVFIQGYQKYIYTVPFFIFLDVVCELSMPLLMAHIIDVGIPNKDVGDIQRMGLYMTLLACAAICFGILNMKFTATGAMGFGANLRDALFTKVQQFSFTNIDQFSTASLVTRLTNDVNNLQLTFMMMMRILLRAPMMLIIAFILAFSINHELSLVLAVAIPLLALSILVIMRTATRRFHIVQAKVDDLNRTIQENLIGIRVVKSYVREDHEKQKFKQSNDDLTNSAIRAVNIAIMNMPVMMLVMNGAVVAIIWFGGRMVSFGSLGAGELISFISYVMQILFSVMMISFVVLMGARAQASAERIVEVLDTVVDIADRDQTVLAPVVDIADRDQTVLAPVVDIADRDLPVLSPVDDIADRNQPVLAPEVDIVDGDQPTLAPAVNIADGDQLTPTPVVSQGRVEFRNVSFKYNLTGTGENVLSNISFTAEPGKVIAIVGGTGTGKSTLVNLIPRLYDVSEGSVLVDGVDVRDYALDTLRGAIGVVLQKNTLFSGTIRENLRWGNEDATEEEIITACQDAQAHSFIMSFPKGYDTELGQGGVNVSGGQKQRLCIARAMLKNPRILILDDSTSAVDSATEAKIRESFYQNLSDTTVFIIAQRISSVRDADQILVLDDGKIVGCGTHAELIATNAVYQEINASQQEGVLANE
jgi:ATP-binding cassette subfamily B protein